MLALASDCQRKQLRVEALDRRVKQLEKLCAQERLDHVDVRREQQNDKHRQIRWTVDKVKNKMGYYTDFSKDKFTLILNFLAPTPEVPFVATKKLKKVLDTLSLEQQFLLVMVKLRQNFDLAHLATIFQIRATEAGQLFKKWINYMFFGFGEIPTWPDKEVLIQNRGHRYQYAKHILEDN